jgi:hypothetical protein
MFPDFSKVYRAPFGRATIEKNGSEGNGGFGSLGQRFGAFGFLAWAGY